MVKTSKLTDLATVFSWFCDAETIREWAGPLVKLPYDPSRSLTEIQWDLSEPYTMYKNDKPIGFVQVFKRYGFNHISRLAIAPRHRSNGLGRILIEHLLSNPPHPHFGFSLFVYSNNLIARSLYEQLCFVEEQYPPNQATIKGCMFMVRKQNQQL